MHTKEGREKRVAQDARIEAQLRNAKEEQRELLGELREAGVDTDMVNRLPMTPTREYVHALPILSRHLHREYSEGTLESIARSMATPAASVYWDDLVAMYRKQRGKERTRPGNFAMGLAAAVAASCPPARMNELVELLRDRALPDRVLLLAPLRKRRGRDPVIAEVLEELREDPDLVKEISSWKQLKNSTK
jgi:hypothetical protein